MNRLLFILSLIPMINQAQVTNNSKVQAPVVTKIPKQLVMHGHTRIDNYFWMNERDSKPVLDHLALENAYTDAYYKKLEGLKNTLLKEFNERIDPNDQKAPFVMNKRTYQIRNLEGKDYEVIYLLDGKKESVFFDENERAKGKSFYSLADWSPSPDNSMLAISEDFVGRRKYTITIRSNKNGKFLADQIKDTDGSIVWAEDNKTFFYVKKDPQTLREFQVYRHELGTSPKKDVLVFQENDERFGVAIGKSTNNQYIFIHCYSSTTTEMSYIDAKMPAANPTVFIPREKGHIYEVDVHEKGFYILSNKNAENKQVLFSPSLPIQLDKCTMIYKHDPDVLIESMLTLKNYFITETRENGLRKIKVLNLSSGKSNAISFNEETYYTGLAVNDDYEAEDLFYTYNSLTTPSTVFKYHLSNQTQSLWFRKELLDKNFSSDNYVSERIWATSNDGHKIPVSIIYKKGTDISKAPCLLYGYGSYGYTLPDVFSATRLSLLDRGFVYAVAHIRGSKYMGESWYEDGKFLKKRNTFTDFINAAEYLGMKGYCDPSRIYAQGGSAGGLLMGAVTNMAPYLWKGIIAQVPFVDVVTTMLDESIPLTVGEYEEWGNPNEEDYYFYMLNYSPYDNVRAMHYPAMLVTTGYHDSQVQYWEPMKWVAKLREMKQDGNPLLFDCNMDAGHGGGSGRTQERLETAKEFAFILNMEGIEK